MATKRRKVSEAQRQFNPDWEHEFVFVEIESKPFCLLCKKFVSVLKKSNLQRHHETCHPEFVKAYAQGSTLRTDKITSLLTNYNDQQSSFRSHFRESDIVTEASYKMAWHIGRSKRPFTEGEIMKKCFIDCSESLFNDLKNKDEILLRISKLQASDSTIARRVEDISQDLFSKLCSDLENTEYFSLAIDESTDRSDTAQLIVWVRYSNGEEFVEEMLALLPLKLQTRGEDIYTQIMTFFKGPGKRVVLNKLVSITTDGAPSMVGKDKGLIALFRKNNDIPEFFAYHCILHQEQLCCKLKKGGLRDTMEKVVKIVNFIIAHALKHRQFKSLLEEYETYYNDLSLHSQVRWLSRGKVLARFMELLPVIREFVQEMCRNDLLISIKEESFQLQAAFLTDITHHLNVLNLKLQGKSKILPNMMNDVSAFQSKLDLFSKQLVKMDFTHFPCLKLQISKISATFFPEQYLKYIDDLVMEFSSRFSDIKRLAPMLELVENPFCIDIQVVSEITKSFGVEKSQFEEEMIDLQHNYSLKARHYEIMSTNFWMHYVSNGPYPAVFRCVKKILTCFGSTYMCESSFSHMGAIKSKLRTSLSDKHLNDCLRLSTTGYNPDLKGLVKKMQTQSTQ